MEGAVFPIPRGPTKFTVGRPLRVERARCRGPPAGSFLVLWSRDVTPSVRASLLLGSSGLPKTQASVLLFCFVELFILR